MVCYERPRLPIWLPVVRHVHGGQVDKVGRCPAPQCRAEEVPVDFDEALALAEEHHGEQTDKAGHPYMGHIRRVVDAVDSPQAKLAAALHDIVEDTHMTAERLVALDCPPEVVRAVEALTRREGEDYETFVARAAKDPIARVVKRADVADNGDKSRLALLPPIQADRLRAKYARAAEILDF